MKILVLGHNGQLGRVFVETIRNRGADEVVKLDGIDITDAVRVAQGIAMLRPELVINCAAYTEVDRAETERDLADAVNRLGVLYLADACATIGCRILHFSTDYVFDGRKHRPYLETDPTEPLNVYGHSKLAGELVLRSHVPTLAMIIRTSWLYGENPDNFVVKIAERILAGETVRIVDDQVGSPTYTGLLVECALALIDIGSFGEIFHCSGEGSCSWFEVAKEIAGHFQCRDLVLPMKTEEMTRAAQRARYSVLSKQKLSGILPFAIPDWRVTLKNFIQSRYPKYLCIFWLLAGFVSCGGAANKQQKIEDPAILTQIAEEYIRKNEGLRALQTLSEAEKIANDDYRIAKLFGIAYLARRQYLRSEEYFEKALAVATSEKSEAHLYLSHLYLAIGDWNKAIVHCKEALNDPISPFPHIAYNNLGWAYYNLEDYLRALESFRYAIANQNGYVVAYYNLGLTYLKIKHYGQAGNTFVKAISYCKQCDKHYLAELYYRLAVAYQMSGSDQKAHFYFEKCRTTDEKSRSGRECQRMVDLIDKIGTAIGNEQ